jgi:hypothetical protein
MKTIHFCFILPLFFLVDVCVAKAQPWNNAINWTLYDLKGTKFYKLPVDSLLQLPHLKLDSVMMGGFLLGATQLPPKKTPAWMGAYVVSYIYQQQIHKVDISTYNGFFYDESSNTFYQIEAEKQKNWHDYLAKSMNSLLSNP